MGEDGDLRSLAQTLGSAALGVSLGLGVLVIGFAVSRIALPESGAVVSTLNTASPTRSAQPTPAPTTAAPSRTPSPPPTPSPTPAPTADPMVVTAFQGQGLRLAAIAIPKDYTLKSPIGGKVRIELYQYVDGEIRTGVPDQPTYPYIFVTAADREIKVRPGVIDRDVRLLVKDGDAIAAGAPLFTTLTTGLSSWQTFYDRGITAQVVVSARDVASDEEIDPVALFKK